MLQNQEDIGNLAEDIGNNFLSDNKVILEAIAQSENIRIIRGNYGDYFLGELVHYLNKFYIILNIDMLNSSESGRVRFTIAHELGHYFIDEHRNKLKNGISLSFRGNYNPSELKKIESAANHFAANLLMPKKQFIRQYIRLEPNLSGILILKEKYDTSVECTLLHSINLNLSTCLMLKWREDATLQYAICTQKFKDIFGIKNTLIPLRYDIEYIRKILDISKKSNFDIVESATLISKWITTICHRGKDDKAGLEQMIKLGDFGGITLITI